MGRVPSSKSSPERAVFNRRKQVAAVCYRIGKRGIQFLLVQTRSGRWIFPKGGVESGLTNAQSAALEAFEEAGVHGRIEEIPFTRYFRRRPNAISVQDESRPGRIVQLESPVTAYLCEVIRLEAPQEANRNPTWFSTEKAKQSLAEDRSAAFAAELCEVVDRALIRIQRLGGIAPNGSDREHSQHTYKDPLREVRFERFAGGVPHEHLSASASGRHLIQLSGVESHPLRLLQPSAPSEISRPILRLGPGEKHDACPTGQSLEIENARGAAPTKTISRLSRRRKARGKTTFAVERWLN
jgi:8-oxo-dGTP pyrophosphatase MutT (NUDIX family)